MMSHQGKHSMLLQYQGCHNGYQIIKTLLQYQAIIYVNSITPSQSQKQHHAIICQLEKLPLSVLSTQKYAHKHV